MDHLKYFEGIQRIKKLAERAKSGEELTIGFFGGSITQGSLATDLHKCYAYRVFEWFEKEWPHTHFHYVNGGIGGTTSHFGVSRVQRDLLMYRPDFVVVDFSVNDDADQFFQETYEGLIRKIWYSESKPAVILLNNVFYDTGETAEKLHTQIGDHYQIPHVSIKDSIYKDIQEGKFTREDISSDGLHPNDLGHEKVAHEIITAIKNILKEKVETSATMSDNESVQKPSITMNAYENAVRYTIENSTPVLKGFRADSAEKLGHLDFFKNGWSAAKKGDKICFTLEASCIAIQYRKTINRPSPIARAILDGRSDEEIILDGNFNEDWGDCLYIEPVLHHGEYRVHTLEIEIINDDGGQDSPFYLLSVIAV